MGADIVIAVDVSHVNREVEITSIYDISFQSLDILQMELVESREFASDVMIRPQVEKYGSKSFTNLPEIITIGEEAARQKVDILKNVLRPGRSPLKNEP